MMIFFFYKLFKSNVYTCALMFSKWRKWIIENEKKIFILYGIRFFRMIGRINGLGGEGGREKGGRNKNGDLLLI